MRTRHLANHRYLWTDFNLSIVNNNGLNFICQFIYSFQCLNGRLCSMLLTLYNFQFV